MSNEFQWDTEQESYETLGETGEVYGEQEYGEYGELGEYGEYGEYGEQESTFGEYGESESPFNEIQEMELAAELLSVTNENELEQFLGNLISRAGSAVGSFIRSPTGQALGGILKDAAKQAVPILKSAAGKALPVLGGAIGGYFGGASGAATGQDIASKAGRIFGLELEGLSGEDQEFEVARRYVRFAGAASANAARAQRRMPPRAAAQKAATQAARRHAPGLLRGRGAAAQRPGGRPATAGRLSPGARPGMPGRRPAAGRAAPQAGAPGQGGAGAGAPQPGGPAGGGLPARRPRPGGGSPYFPSSTYNIMQTGGGAQPGGMGDSGPEDSGMGAEPDPSGGLSAPLTAAPGPSPNADLGGAPGAPSASIDGVPLVGGSGRWMRKGRQIIIFNC